MLTHCSKRRRCGAPSAEGGLTLGHVRNAAAEGGGKADGRSRPVLPPYRLAVIDRRPTDETVTAGAHGAGCDRDGEGDFVVIVIRHARLQRWWFGTDADYETPQWGEVSVQSRIASSVLRSGSGHGFSR